MTLAKLLREVVTFYVEITKGISSRAIGILSRIRVNWLWKRLQIDRNHLELMVSKGR